MLRPRIIPCLLIHQGGLVKTVKFAQPKYVGDPLNAVRIFNEKEVDELIVIDIDATTEGRVPDYQLIANLAGECRMPLCYGGGISSPEQVEKIISLGVEKVAISSAAIKNHTFIKESAYRVGSQSIVVVMDIKKTGYFKKSYELFINNGHNSVRFKPAEFAKIAQESGAGEIVINSIDRDGTLEGYDFELIDIIRDAVTIPVTALGGAGSFEHLKSIVAHYGIIGAAAGSIFVFKGKYRAVLIQYPNTHEKEIIIRSENLLK